MEIGGEAHASTVLPREKIPGIHSLGSCVHPVAGLDFWKRNTSIVAAEIQTPDRSQYTNFGLPTEVSRTFSVSQGKFCE